MNRGAATNEIKEVARSWRGINWKHLERSDLGAPGRPVELLDRVVKPLIESFTAGAAVVEQLPNSIVSNMERAIAPTKEARRLQSNQ